MVGVETLPDLHDESAFDEHSYVVTDVLESFGAFLVSSYKDFFFPFINDLIHLEITLRVYFFSFTVNFILFPCCYFTIHQIFDRLVLFVFS